MGAITQNANIEILEKLPDGNFEIKYPKTISSQVLGLGDVFKFSYVSTNTQIPTVGSASVNVVLPQIPTKYIKAYGTGFSPLMLVIDIVNNRCYVMTDAIKTDVQGMPWSGSVATTDASLLLTGVSLSGATLTLTYYNSESAYPRTAGFTGMMEVM